MSKTFWQLLRENCPQELTNIWSHCLLKPKSVFRPIDLIYGVSCSVAGNKKYLMKRASVLRKTHQCDRHLTHF